MKEIENAHKILDRRSEGLRPLGRPGFTRVDNTKIDVKEIGLEGRD
jgi:hypothetical protein